MKRSLIILSVFFAVFTLFAKNPPDWVKKRPISTKYYIGIGVATKSKANKDYLQIAKDNALKNLASEIKVHISSEVFSKMSEENGKLKELVQSTVKTTTQADLEGYEIVDTYEDKNNYWLYCRLSKDVYLENERKKRTKALEISLALYQKAKTEENKQISYQLQISIYKP